MSKDNSKQIINAGCACATDKGIWFVHYVVPLLMFYDFDEKKVVFSEFIPCTECRCPFGIYSGIMYSNNKLFIIALLAKESFVYDIDVKCFKKIEICANESERGFYGTCLNDGFVYAIPLLGDVITRINVDSEKVEYLKTETNMQRLNSANYVEDNSFLCTAISTSKLYKYEVKNNICKELIIREEECSFGYVDYFNGKYYGYDYKTKKIICFNDKGIIEKKSNIIGIESVLITHTYNGKIVLDDNYSGKIYLLNEDLVIEKVIDTDVPNNKLVSPYKIGCWINYNGNTYDISKSNELIVINEDGIERINLYMNQDIWDDMANKYVNKKLAENQSVLEEDELCNLKEFLKSI